MKKEKTVFRQLVPGNPGTSFIVCLLYTLKTKYGIETTNKDQLSIFTQGIVSSLYVFWCGIINTLAAKFKQGINVFTNNEIVFRLARNEINEKLIKLEVRRLKGHDLVKLLDRFRYLKLFQ